VAAVPVVDAFAAPALPHVAPTPLVPASRPAQLATHSPPALWLAARR
jgi:hypothetical protein